MSKKTLALISGLVLVTLVLFVIALKSNQSSNQGPKPTDAMKPVPTVSVAHSVLTLSPNPVTVAPGGVGKVSVNVDTSDNPVTAVQLEISFDSKSLSNVQVETGPLFQNSVVLIGNTSASNRTANQTGKFTFAFGRTPGQAPVKGTGIVATISFTVLPGAKTSQLILLPTTLVTARGVANSVLKSSTGTQVVVGSGGGVALPQIQSSPSAGL